MKLLDFRLVATLWMLLLTGNQDTQNVVAFGFPGNRHVGLFASLARLRLPTVLGCKHSSPAIVTSGPPASLLIAFRQWSPLGFGIWASPAAIVTAVCNSVNELDKQTLHFGCLLLH